MESDDTSIKIRTGSVSWRELGDEIVVLDLDRSAYLTVTGAGTVVWRRAVSGTTLGAVLEELREIYDVTDEVARADVSAFLADLRERNLLVDP